MYMPEAFKRWTPAEIFRLKNLYPEHQLATVAILLKRSESSVRGKVRELGLKHSKEFWDRHNKQTRFKQGHTTLKGRKWEQIYSKEVIDELKSKRRSSAHKPGDVWLNKPKNRLMYCTEDGRHVRYHIFIWEKYMGKLEKNEFVIFKDGNPLNCDISNLKKTTKQELVKVTLNSVSSDEIHRRRIKAGKSRKINKIKKKLEICPFLKDFYKDILYAEGN